MKHCFMCKGSLEDKTTTFMADLGSCIVIIKNVPSQVCTQCGEVSYTDEVAAELERISNSLKQSVTEIAIIDFNKAA
ncbi:YgiT-type zinc finger protein [uncultured Phascolarctobacterium sp.]|uniref:type II toxin-antitoxin system MqsA family antitoxin n=1 Tax=uncultured Phascolarctobacterium sp. TaxID=512296 RepID=UPI0027D9816D|nr:YgiT-type zinc finger protein [uncultured Phascolarctobacterium sp.]